MTKREMRRVAMRGMAAASTLTVGAALTCGVAVADPSGAKNQFSFPASCTNGSTVQDLQFVVNSANGQGQGTNNNPKGQANWSPAHVAGSNQIFHPTDFNLDFTFTPANGEPETFHDSQVKPNGKTSSSCTIDYTAPPDAAGNTFGLKGTVLGYFT
jgi:hypothetical protein